MINGALKRTRMTRVVVDRFMCPVGEDTLCVMGAILRTLSWTMDRSNVADLRRETVRWLGRVVELNISITADPIETMTAALSWWKRFVTDNEASVEAMRSARDDRPYRALSWVMRIHLESFCYGFVDVPKEGEDNKEETTRLDKSLVIMQNACSLVSLVEMSPLVLSTLGDTIADVSSKMISVDVVAALFASLTATLTCDDSSGVDNVPSAIALSEIIQHTLSDIMSTGFSIIEQRIDKRIQQQYEKARKYSTSEELSEIESKRLRPPLWEYCAEIISFEPKLWANLLCWAKSDSFAISREKTPWSNTLTRMCSKVEGAFLEINDAALKGHLTVELLRKIYSNKDQLIPGWRVLDCAMGTSGLIEELEGEIQNALIEVKTISKVRLRPIFCLFCVSDVLV